MNVTPQGDRKRGRPFEGLVVPFTLWLTPDTHQALSEVAQRTGQSLSAVARAQLAPLVRPKAPAPLPPPPRHIPAPKPPPILPTVNEAADELYWAQMRAKHCPPELEAQLVQKAKEEERLRQEAAQREAAYWEKYRALCDRIRAAEGEPPERERFADKDAALERLEIFARRAEKDLAEHLSQIPKLREAFATLGQPVPSLPHPLPKAKEREFLEEQLFLLNELKEQREKLVQLGGVLPNPNDFANQRQELTALKAIVVQALKAHHQKRTSPPLPPKPTTPTPPKTPPKSAPKPKAPALPGGAFSRLSTKRHRGRDPD